MSKTHIEFWECVCDKCGHAWVTRTKDPPKVCPKCKRKDWDSLDKDVPHYTDNVEVA